jgi:excisionase family DNA binding protein
MRLLTYKEVGEELSISVRYLQKCVKERELPCIHFGRAVRFDPDAVGKWVNNRNHGTAPPIVDGNVITNRSQ